VSRLHREAKRVFLEALGVPADERADFVREASGGDEALEAEVSSLLRHHDELALGETEGAGLLERLRSALRAVVGRWAREAAPPGDRPPREPPSPRA
jgi:hypothetical protein